MQHASTEEGETESYLSNTQDASTGSATEEGEELFFEMTCGGWGSSLPTFISKAGLRNLSFTLADELAQSNIHVATVTIGGVVKK